MTKDNITDDLLRRVRGLNEIAEARGQTLARMALAWLHRSPVVSSVIIGASRLSQIEDAAKVGENLSFSEDELRQIDELTKE